MMFYTTPCARQSSRTDKPNNPDCRHRADFARTAVFSEFGYRSGRALDHADFVDRQPGEMPARAPEARSK